jgi:hypothetical protein
MQEKKQAAVKGVGTEIQQIRAETALSCRARNGA